MKTIRKSFPEKGTEASALLPEMRTIKTKDVDWKNGRMFGYIYYPGDEAAHVVEEAYQMFCSENALNPSLFVSLKQFENETVQMMTDLLNGGPDAAGSLTSGGTESILMTVKTARDKARADHPEIKFPEVVLPESVHPAFDKAAHYLDVKLIHTPVRADKRADVGAMSNAITENTILLVGSAPCFPHGVIDPIGEIGELALENNILFHVDACMGGMMLPFAEKLGYPIPPFDFRVPGVTSISADIHKYGYSPKGASVIIYASHELRKYQFFVYTDWSGGLYGSPTMLGTRCGGPIAAAWASLVHHGLDGYLRMAREVMETSKKMQAGINAIPGLQVISDPDMSIFAFTSDQLDIFEVGDELTSKQWYLDRIQFPGSLHMTVSYHNVKHADEFVAAVREAVAKVTSEKGKSRTTHFMVSFVKGLSRVLPEIWFKKLSSAAAGLMGNKDDERHGMTAAMYGITEKIENRQNVHELVLNVLDRMY
jgi:glutamate/tyrosine decarboxylase-like PLP-dependent enzyme